jgi:hypothetical protein
VKTSKIANNAVTGAKAGELPGPRHVRRSAAEGNQWKHFVDWCESHEHRAFPASVETVLRFLLDGPLRGRELYRAWAAIGGHHHAYYWHADANPQLLLKLGGAEVTGDGIVRVPKEILEEFGLSR